VCKRRIRGGERHRRRV